MAGEGGVISSAEEVMRWVEIFPGSICSREEALGGVGARGVLIGKEGGGVGEVTFCQLGAGGHR